MPLVLTRTVGEEIVIGEEIVVRVESFFRSKRVRLSIKAPRDVNIRRGEIEREDPWRDVGGESGGA